MTELYDDCNWKREKKQTFSETLLTRFRELQMKIDLKHKYRNENILPHLR